MTVDKRVDELLASLGAESAAARLIRLLMDRLSTTPHARTLSDDLAEILPAPISERINVAAAIGRLSYEAHCEMVNNLGSTEERTLRVVTLAVALPKHIVPEGSFDAYVVRLVIDDLKSRKDK